MAAALVAVLLLGIYCATAIAGAGMGLSHAFTAFFSAALIGAGLLAGEALGFTELVQSVAQSAM